ncbi:MAG: CHASE3 domain-containing protein [Acetobacteraceae bacterium]
MAPSRVLPIVASVVFVLFIVGAAWIAGSLATRTGLVQHSLTVETSLSDLLSSLQDAETGQRGYLLTSDEAYLAPQIRASEAIGAEFAALRAAIVDNPTQLQALSELQVVTEARLAILRHAIELQRVGDVAGALAVVRSDRGRDLMDHARAIIAGMRAEEARVLVRRSAAAAFFSRTLLGVIVASGILALLSVGLWFRGAHRYAGVLERAREDLHSANTGLEAKVAERTAELRDSNDEIQRFAYIVSHDLRAPLVNIMGFTSELEATREDIRAELPETPKSQAIDRDFAEALGFIKAAIAKMDGLIGAILKISRDGRRAFRPELLDVTALVRGLADAQRHQAEEAGAVVTVGALPAITADRLAVEQVFGNLLDNAIKYLDPGRRGRIEVSGQVIGPRVRYEIRDNGRGIAPSDHERVFELFRRAGAQDRPGEGIGLAYVRMLVRSMGGRIEVASESGVGTIFSVTLLRTPPTV